MRPGDKGHGQDTDRGKEVGPLAVSQIKIYIISCKSHETPEQSLRSPFSASVESHNRDKKGRAAADIPEKRGFFPADHPDHTDQQQSQIDGQHPIDKCSRQTACPVKDRFRRCRFQQTAIGVFTVLSVQNKDTEHQSRQRGQAEPGETEEKEPVEKPAVNSHGPLRRHASHGRETTDHGDDAEKPEMDRHKRPKAFCQEFSDSFFFSAILMTGLTFQILSYSHENTGIDHHNRHKPVPSYIQGLAHKEQGNTHSPQGSMGVDPVVKPPDPCEKGSFHHKTSHPQNLPPVSSDQDKLRPKKPEIGRRQHGQKQKGTSENIERIAGLMDMKLPVGQKAGSEKQPCTGHDQKSPGHIGKHTPGGGGKDQPCQHDENDADDQCGSSQTVSDVLLRLYGRPGLIQRRLLEPGSRSVGHSLFRMRLIHGGPAFLPVWLRIGCRCKRLCLTRLFRAQLRCLRSRQRLCLARLFRARLRCLHSRQRLCLTRLFRARLRCLRSRQRLCLIRLFRVRPCCLCSRQRLCPLPCIRIRPLSCRRRLSPVQSQFPDPVFVSIVFYC